MLSHTEHVDAEKKTLIGTLKRALVTLSAPSWKLESFARRSLSARDLRELHGLMPTLQRLAH